MLTRRLQVLLDEDRWVRLNRKATESRQSVGALVREAIDRVYPADDDARRAAAKAVLSMEPMPIDDWGVLKTEINEMYESRA